MRERERERDLTQTQRRHTDKRRGNVITYIGRDWTDVTISQGMPGVIRSWN